jgi:cardiolipin synthase
MRLLAAPLTIWLILVDQMAMAFYVFLAAGVSDAIDGFLARRLGVTSDLGAILDGLADKVLLVCIYVTLGVHGALPIWLAILVITRDVLIVGAVLLSYTLGPAIALHPLIISKVNTMAQIILAALVLASLGFDLGMERVVSGLVYVVAATTITSGASYMIAWIRTAGTMEKEALEKER